MKFIEPILYNVIICYHSLTDGSRIIIISL